MLRVPEAARPGGQVQRLRRQRLDGRLCLHGMRCGYVCLLHPMNVRDCICAGVAAAATQAPSTRCKPSHLLPPLARPLGPVACRSPPASPPGCACLCPTRQACPNLGCGSPQEPQAGACPSRSSPINALYHPARTYGSAAPGGAWDNTPSPPWPLLGCACISIKGGGWPKCSLLGITSPNSSLYVECVWWAAAQASRKQQR